MKKGCFLILLLSALLVVSSCAPAAPAGTETDAQTEPETAPAETAAETVPETAPETEKPPLPRKIACVGDSITYGVGASDRTKTSYPVLLQKLLGSGTAVRNFGRSRAYAINNKNEEYKYASDQSVAYTETAEYRSSLSFLPDAVVIMLGTNDAYVAHQNTDVAAKFHRELSALVKSYQSLSSSPKIYLILCVDRYDTAIRKKNLAEVILPEIESVARELGTEVIDLHTPTAPYATTASGYYTDGIHLTDVGYELMADEIYKSLTK
ncbi:MAG: hypothetical protein II771_04110 [Clostridia bacterium]|nr:hypothetical protein [Clostridia bacterium]